MTATAHPGALDPDATATRHSQIAKAAQTDRPKAIRLAAQAKADGLRSPLLHYLIAQNLRAAGRFEDAIAELGLSLELAPNEAGVMTEVGFCLMELDRTAEAAKVFEAAIGADPSWAPASYGYGWAAERLGALDQARSAWERTLKLNPRHPEALAALAGLAARRGDWPTARDLADRALESGSDQSDTLTTLARADLGEGDFNSAIDRARQVISTSSGDLRAAARLLLGDALDAAGRYGEAFSAYADGKSELRALQASRFAIAGKPSATEVVRDILAEFETTPAESWSGLPFAGKSGPARGHAFLLGFPRSGTTLLEQIIATHPDMAALGERPVLIEAVLEFLSGTGGMERLAATVSDLLEPYRDSYWSRVKQFVPDLTGKVFVDKYPLGTIRLPLMRKLFPEASIIFALRDPRDVVLSCFRRAFKMNASMYEFTNLERAAFYYDAVMSAGEVYLARLPLKVHRLRYEDLVADFEGEGRSLCEFLGVEWTPALQNFAATERTIATPSSTQVARGLYSEGAGQWRNYADQLAPVAPILAPWVEKFGYEA
jgi:tetratricopeptide (TPR) repeat protein